MTLAVNPEAVLKLIQSDITACEQLLALLDEEQTALTNRDAEALSEIIDKKVPCMAHLEQSANTRSQWAQASAIGQVDTSWTLMISESDSNELKDTWERLKSLLQECQLKNEVNGKLLARNQQVFGRLLDIVRGQNTAKNLYNATGGTSGGNRSQIVGEA